MYLTGVLVKEVVPENFTDINYDGIGCVMSGMHMLPVYYTTTNTRKRKKSKKTNQFKVRLLLKKNTKSFSSQNGYRLS